MRSKRVRSLRPALPGGRDIHVAQPDRGRLAQAGFGAMSATSTAARLCVGKTAGVATPASRSAAHRRDQLSVHLPALHLRDQLGEKADSSSRTNAGARAHPFGRSLRFLCRYADTSLP